MTPSNVYWNSISAHIAVITSRTNRRQRTKPGTCQSEDVYSKNNVPNCSKMCICAIHYMTFTKQHCIPTQFLQSNPSNEQIHTENSHTIWLSITPFHQTSYNSYLNVLLIIYIYIHKITSYAKNLILRWEALIFFILSLKKKNTRKWPNQTILNYLTIPYSQTLQVCGLYNLPGLTNAFHIQHNRIHYWGMLHRNLDFYMPLNISINYNNWVSAVSN